jgi:hypothetical protein
MSERELKPALVMRIAERVNVKELVKTPGGLAVDADSLYRYVGDVGVEKITGKDGTTVKRWFAWTLLETSLGPFPNRVKAVQALLEWNGLREARPEETMDSLF